MVTMNPASTSRSTITVSRKKVEVEKALESRNSIRQAMNRIIDREWLTITTRWLVVDFKSSMNRITRDANARTSPSVTGQRPPDAIGTAISWRVITSLASTE